MVVEEVWRLELSGRLGEATDGLAMTAYTVFTPVLAVTDATIARALSIAET